MSPTLDLGDALSAAVGALATRGGLLLVALYAVYQLIFQVAYQSLLVDVYATYLSTAEAESAAEGLPFALGIPMALAALVLLAALVAGVTFSIVAARALYADLERFPTPEHTRRLVAATAVGIVVNVITFVAVFVGTLLLVIPGLFLAVSLAFAIVVVAVEDAGIVESLERSWSLASGHRWRLFALVIVIAVIGGIVGLVPGVLSIASPLAGGLLGTVVGGFTTVFSLGAVVRAYRQLAEGGGDVDESVGALGPEDIPQ